MEKILIMLEVPSIGESFEVWIPSSLEFSDLARVLGKSVEELTEGRYLSSGMELLCMREYNSALQETFTVKDYGIQNGEHLLLM